MPVIRWLQTLRISSEKYELPSHRSSSISRIFLVIGAIGNLIHGKGEVKRAAFA